MRQSCSPIFWLVPHALGQKLTFETGEGPRLSPAITSGDRPRQAGRRFRYEGVGAGARNDYKGTSRTAAPSGACLAFVARPGRLQPTVVCRLWDPGSSAGTVVRISRSGWVWGEIDRCLDTGVDRTTSRHNSRPAWTRFNCSIVGRSTRDRRSSIVGARKPAAKIVAGLRQKIPGARIIGFPRGAGTSLVSYVDDVPFRCDRVGLDDQSEVRP